jgi:ATP-dependent Clp protease ATP-binding subunit ClpA
MSTENVAPDMLHGWAIYLQASEEARRRGDRRTGTDHLLLALLGESSVQSLLGVTLEQARRADEALDQEALDALGMTAGAEAPDLPMRPVPKKPKFREVVKKDHPRLTPAAKKALEQASKGNRRRAYVTAEQVLTKILALQPPDPAAVLLEALGVDASEVQRRLGDITPNE